MITKELQQALDNTETTYSQLNKIANEILLDYTKDIDQLIKDTSNKINDLNNDEIRSLMLKLALKSYSIGEIKEKASLKSTCAEALRKEAYAIKYNEVSGKLGEKENQALVAISNEILTEAIYDLVANLLKTKSNEIHSIIDVLKTILVSRMSEMKLNNTTNEGIDNI